MKTTTGFSRRGFVIGSAAAGGGLALGFALPEAMAEVSPKSATIAGDEVGAWVLIRPNDDVVIRQGIMRTEQPLQYIGQLTTGLEVWSYKDTFDIPLTNGGKQRVDVFNEKDIIMVAPGATGLNVRGPIFDAEAMQAGLSSAQVFAKQWYEKDPSDFWQMHQSSYLPIPLYPNRVAKARVLA